MLKFQDLREGGEAPSRVKIPGKEKEHAAMLSYSPDEGVSMSLIDIEASFFDALEKKIAGKRDHPGVIHGKALGCGPLTMLDCLECPGSHGDIGVGQTIYMANSLIAGWRIESDQIPCVKSAAVRLTMLDTWMSRVFTSRTFSPKIFEAPVGEGIEASAKYVEQFKHHAEATGVTLESSQSIGFGKTDSSVTTINNRSSWILRFDEPVTIVAAKEELYRLQCLFSLLCGKQSHPTMIVLEAEKENDLGLDRQAYLLGAYAYKARDSITIPQQLLTHQQMVEPYLAQMWAEWQRKIDVYSVPVELHASTSVFGDQLTQFEYLSAVQALEVLHRRMNPPGGKQRTALLTRLRSLCDNLPGPLQAAIHPKLTEMLEKVKDTRDELTHSLGHPPAKIFARDELHAAALWLRWFFTAWMLHALGLPSDVIVEALGKERQLKSLHDIIS